MKKMPADVKKAQIQLASGSSDRLYTINGQQYLVIDQETALKENSKAERQCQDNLTAFHQFKQ